MHDQIAVALRQRLRDEKVVVFCSQQEDSPAWKQLLEGAGAEESLVLAFDGPELSALLPPRAYQEAEGLVARRNTLLATLAGRSPLADLLDGFDRTRRAVLVVTDPLEPRGVEDRLLLGAKHPSWAIFEHKSAVDTLWDVMGVDRAESLVLDQPGKLLYQQESAFTGVVASWQLRGGVPSAGGAGVRTVLTENRGGPYRVRVMPRLAGRPCRLHGLAGADATAVFLPLELLAPHRTSSGTFLCAGATPLPRSEQAELVTLTQRFGDRLRACLAYRGGFSVDGVLTADGFRPTDLNTRVTSVLESLPASVRVAVHACALLARTGSPGLPGGALEKYVDRAFHGTADLLIRAPFLGSDTQVRRLVRWTGSLLEDAGLSEPHGIIEVGAGARGPTFTARLRRSQLPAELNPQSVTIAAFEAADRLLGAEYGVLEQPDGAVPVQRTGAV